MNFGKSVRVVVQFAKRFVDQANDEEKAALERCERSVEQRESYEAAMDDLKKRIDEHTLYLRSGWAIEKPVAPDNTYDLLREISRTISADGAEEDEKSEL